MNKIVKGLFCLVASLAAGAVEATTFYASPAGGGDGSSAESPTTLAEAVAKATTEGAGAVVQLSADTFEQTAQTTIAADITVQGAGRDQTIVTAKGITTKNKFRLFTLNSAGAVLKDMTVENGDPGGIGGNILIETGGGLVQNCVIRGGFAKGNSNGGGGVALRAGEVCDSIITNNTADTEAEYDHSGAGVFFSLADNNAKAKLSRSIVAYNKSKCAHYAAVATGGIVVSSSSKGVSTIESCTIAYNEGSHTGGLYPGVSSTVVTNCLFTGNIASRGSATYTDFYKNLGKIVQCAFDEGAAITGTSGVSGRQAFEPGGFVPTFDAACVGAADDGQDIGAVQHRPVTGPTAYVVVSDVKIAKTVPVEFSVFATDASGAALESCEWDFGDGSAKVSGVSVSHAYAAVGVYSPKATVTVGGVTLVVEADKVDVGEKDAYVSAGGDLKTAVDAAYPHSTVHVAPGNYTLSSQQTVFDQNDKTSIVIDKPIAVVADSADPYATKISETKTSTRLFYVKHPDALLAGFTIMKGEVKTGFAHGGGLVINCGIVSNCVITGCKSTGHNTGGAALCSYGGLVTHCIISNNTSTITQYQTNGGAVYMTGGTVRNTLICNNEGKNNDGYEANVGGVAIFAGGTLENCTIAGNSGPGCGGVWVRKNSATIRNCAIFGNDSAAASEVDRQVRGTKSNFKYCASTVAFTGGDNCVFGTMAAASVQQQNWRPQFGSVSIGAGHVEDWMDGAKDLDGNPMLSDEGKTDAGCWQFQKEFIVGHVSTDEIEGVVPLRVVFTALGECESPITSYEWTFGDGETAVTSTNAVAHVYTSVGTHRAKVRMVVAALSKSQEFLVDDPIEVGGARMFVIAGENANAAYPWDSWETAATNLAEVIPYARKGAVVTLGRGVHDCRAQIELTKGFTIAGETGDPADVAIRAVPRRGHRVFRLDHENALVTGLAVQDGGVDASSSGANILVDSHGGIVSNCIVRSGYLCGHDIRGVVTMIAGTLSHCILSNNDGAASSMYSHSGGVLALWGATAVAEYCLITGNRTWCGDNGNTSGIVLLYNGTMRNCSVVGNHAGDGSGNPTRAGYAGTCVNASVGCGGRIVNCVIADNVSEGASESAYRNVGDATSRGYMTFCATDVDIGRAAQGCVFAEDMKFVDPENGDWRVHHWSPAAGKADVTKITATKDLAGAPTVYLRNKADIGCYSRIDKPGMVLWVK